MAGEVVRTATSQATASRFAGAAHRIGMAQEEISKMYGKPRFGLIVGMFCAAIVALLLVGWIVIRYHQPTVKENILPRTGMMILHIRN